MFMGPLEQMKPWSTRGVEGVARFLARVWRLLMTENQAGEWILSDKIKEIEASKQQQKLLHATIKKVTEDIESFSFNTAISQMMIFVNAFTNVETIPLSAMRTFLILLNPFAPHISSELWERLNAGFQDARGDITEQAWPRHDERVLAEKESERAVQVNGRFVGVIKISVSASEEEATNAAKALPKVPQTYSKVFVVGNKVVNFVTK
jgi:leucyl-tRNA synthetase